MYIVDSQVHIWAADTPERPWPKRHAAQQPVPYGAVDLLKDMDEAGVCRAILVPPSWEGERNDLVTEAARMHPDRFAVMGRFDPEAPDARAQLPHWKKQPGMLGMRFTFRRANLAAPLEQGTADWIWAEAEKHDIPVMFGVSHAQAHLIDRIAQRHPRLRLVMDHLSLSSGEKDEAAFANIGNLLALAKRPNIAVKASALPCFTTDAYPYRRLHPWLRQVYDAFGPRRIFWGTDKSRLPCSYAQAITMFTEEIPWLTSEDKEWILGRAITEWLSWPLPAQ
ncbi:MAG: amidohydrolase family protein [Burkholderiales bacterium]